MTSMVWRVYLGLEGACGKLESGEGREGATHASTEATAMTLSPVAGEAANHVP